MTPEKSSAPKGHHNTKRRRTQPGNAAAHLNPGPFLGVAYILCFWPKEEKPPARSEKLHVSEALAVILKALGATS